MTEVDLEYDRAKVATRMLAASFVLPGVAKPVALNLILDGKHEEALTYLLGVTDAMGAIGHPNARTAIELRKSVRDILRGTPQPEGE